MIYVEKGYFVLFDVVPIFTGGCRDVGGSTDILVTNLIITSYTGSLSNFVDVPSGTANIRRVSAHDDSSGLGVMCRNGICRALCAVVSSSVCSCRGSRIGSLVSGLDRAQPGLEAFVRKGKIVRCFSSRGSFGLGGREVVSRCRGRSLSASLSRE